MSGTNRRNKSVSFDLDDEFEDELLKFAEKDYNGRKRNFSKYVKRLIADDKKGGKPNGYPTQYVQDPVKDDKDFYTMEVKDAMSSFFLSK